MNLEKVPYGQYGWIMFDWYGPEPPYVGDEADIDRGEAATVVHDERSITVAVPGSEPPCQRYVTIGITHLGRCVVFTHEDWADDKRLSIRPLEARHPTPEELRQRFADAPAPDGVVPVDFEVGVRGRYAESMRLATGRFYVDDWERYLATYPADIAQTWLWWNELEDVRGSLEEDAVELVLDIRRIREHFHLADDLRFVVVLSGIVRVYAHRQQTTEANWWNEPLNWPEFQQAMRDEGFWLEDARLVIDKVLNAGAVLDADGIMGEYQAHFRIYAGDIGIRRTDGVPCSLEVVEEMGNAVWDAREAAALRRKNSPAGRVVKRFGIG